MVDYADANPPYGTPWSSAGLPRRRKKLRPVEKPVRTHEHGQKRRAARRMRDVDVAARPPHEIARAAAPLGVFQKTFEHKGLFERGVLVQRHDGAGRHLEQDGGAPLVVAIED